MSKADGEFTCWKCNLTFIPSFAFDFYQDSEDPEVGLCENCMLAKAFGVPNGDPQPVPKGYEDAVCKIGQDSATCSFLAWSGSGPKCLKGSSFETAINRKRQEGSGVAKGDNCSGPPDFQENTLA